MKSYTRVPSLVVVSHQQRAPISKKMELTAAISKEKDFWGAKEGTDGTGSDDVMDSYLLNPSSKRFDY